MKEIRENWMPVGFTNNNSGIILGKDRLDILLSWINFLKKCPDLKLYKEDFDLENALLEIHNRKQEYYKWMLSHNDD